ncbi:hypothetical protein HDU67_001210 [Dinochytrium kinnereticum]|nr:hypothetical protein HDU67_001210 [Dinochytrium kinnereticum]
MEILLDVELTAINELCQLDFYTWHIPKDTKRIKLDDGSTLIFKRKEAPTPTVETLPPRLREYPQRSILTKEQIAEARRLRNEDPDTWTIQQLARRYNTFPGFIMRIAPIPEHRRQFLAKQREDEFNRLTISKKMTLIDRMRRKALW